MSTPYVLVFVLLYGMFYLSKPDGAETIILLLISPGLVSLVVAPTVKRLHDIDRSGWWVWPMVIAPGLLLYFASPIWHRRYDAADNYELVWSPGWLWIGLVVVAIALLVWWIVELGTRPGTPGPNRFGPAEYRAIGSNRKVSG